MHLARRQLLGLIPLALLPGCTESMGESGRVKTPGACIPFDEEMVEHSEEFAPILARPMGKRALHAYIVKRMARAESFGFTLRGPVRLFIELSFLFGSSFDTDPQHAWAGKILRETDAEMPRAERLWEGTNDYQDKVTVWAQRKALLRWQLTGRVPTARTRKGLIDEAQAELRRVFPEKEEFVGAAGVRALIEEALTQAVACGLHEPHDQAIVLGLFIALGHSCADDPLFPSVKAAFQVPVATPAERLEHLRFAAFALLRRVAEAG
jgi:hypothetical protein